MVSEMIHVKLSTRVEAGMTVGSPRVPDNLRSLHQIHSSLGFVVAGDYVDRSKQGDWLITDDPKIGLLIRIADCTAILACGEVNGKVQIGAAHAGWRGTAEGILKVFSQAISGWKDLRLWLSPSISQNHFQVGREVLEALGPKAFAYASEFRGEKTQLDLKGFQVRELRQLLPKAEIRSSSLCTYQQKEFFSYRRDKENAGRHSVWIRSIAASV